jgi:hypothetical protein
MGSQIALSGVLMFVTGFLLALFANAPPTFDRLLTVSVHVMCYGAVGILGGLFISIWS